MSQRILILSTLLMVASPLTAAVKFHKRVIDPKFKAEACTAMDMNRDGKFDIIAGENWYQAPDWQPHKFREMPIIDGYADVRCDYPVDINGDGWPDIVTVRRASSMEWLENPKGEDRPWPVHKIGDTPVTEPVWFADIDANGQNDFIAPTGEKNQAIAYWTRLDDPLKPWRLVLVGPMGGDPHGIGAGDIDRDGRIDIVTRTGWYKAPANAKLEWTWHQLDRGQSHQPMVYDFDGDGDQDIAAGAPHDYGLWWWEQAESEDGSTKWIRHEIDMTISQMHAIAMADVDGDGDNDLISGKRYKAHDKGDPGTDDPSMLVWYELKRSGGKAQFSRHDIDNDSGVGYTVTPVDIDADGDVDILTSNKKGTFLFEQEGKPRILPLFSGKDLENWIGDKTLWAVQDGAIVGKTTTGIKHNNFLVSREKYDNFILTLDVKLEPDTANSGIQFRSKPRDDGECEGYQADIGVDWWGSIYEEMGRGILYAGYKGRGEKAVLKNGWNHYVVSAVGDELRVEINGTVCSEIRDHKRKSGIIALQIHSGGPTDVRFKNIVLRGLEE